MNRCIGCGHEDHSGAICDVDVPSFMSTTKCGCKFERSVNSDSVEGEYSFTETLGEYSQKITFKTMSELKEFIQQNWKTVT